MQSFHDIIQNIRSTSINPKQAGSKFEILVLRWFCVTPLYDVARGWLWSDFAKAVGLDAHDLGIDIVLEMRNGEFWAVQCKFYGSRSCVAEGDVSNFLSHQGKMFTPPAADANSNSEKITFSRFLWVDTDAVWNKNAEKLVDRRENFTRLSTSVLANSNVDWDAIAKGKDVNIEPKKLRDYQREVVEKAQAHYKNNSRGKVIMACGTGKTLTSQRIAEAVATTRGSFVLYCVPSIALLGQTYQSWAENAQHADGDLRPAPIFAIGVCSDNRALEKKSNDGDFTAELSIDSPLPATTTVKSVADRLLAARSMHDEGMTVVFTTYQSLQVVADAQAEVLHATGGEFGTFDLIICDEAHRTTGAAKAGLESSFMKIHDDAFIRGKKRLYMTATPRIYTVNAKSDAKKLTSDAVVCSMDDEETYGAEIARISFGQAVNLGCLSDYKVIILTVDPKDLPPTVLANFENKDKSINLPLATQLVGAIHGLSKQLVGDGGRTLAEDPKPCTRAILFASKIGNIEDPGSSVNIEAMFPEVSNIYLKSKSYEERRKFVSIECKHVDGTMNTSERNHILAWLSEDNTNQNDTNVCKVLTNVRCLSEGVDVPALDAVVFMAPKKSQIDIVQSVGRVMRNFRRGEDGGKKYGYIVLPVALSPGEDICEALEKNDRFKEVWSVLCALRAHDENFNAQVNAIRLNMDATARYNTPDDNSATDSSKFIVGTTGNQCQTNEDTGDVLQTSKEQETKIRIARQLELFTPDQGKIFAKLVDKVGTRNYWEGWASDVGRVARDIIAHMNDIIERYPDVQSAFDRYLAGLQKNINTSIDREQAAEMLGQHIIVGPIFDALFADYHFNDNNAVSKTLARMVKKLQDRGLGKDTTILNSFYASIRNQIGDITSPAARQQLIKELYNRFFAVAFPKTVQRLGIVYTPIECVDFIIHSVESLMNREFGRSLSDENVHILDPFVGTGTFITRLLQSGIIKDKDLKRKYLKELHCNEIVLLAYYVADVNIETVFHSLHPSDKYINYDNICLTDTFELNERGQRSIDDLFKENTEQIERQCHAPIQVIIGNPPYSVGQKSANDDNQNLKYPNLDARIDETYVAGSKATNKNSLYDSYIRAFRWATDRIDDAHGGIIGFVTNGGWIDKNTCAGIRKSFYNEFDAIYVVNLRGGVRGMAGDAKKKEGDPFFGAIGGQGGCMATICLTFLIKKPMNMMGEVSPCAAISQAKYAATPSTSPHTPASLTAGTPSPSPHTPASLAAGTPSPLSQKERGKGDADSLRSSENKPNLEFLIVKSNPVNAAKAELAKKFRKEPTPYEDIAWQLLRNRKICNTKWRRQQLIGGYIADFYCPELALILEIDGAVHNTPEAIAYDECRTYFFNSKNINVIRVKNDDCNAEWLTSIIQQYKSAYLNTPLSFPIGTDTFSPSPIGRGGDVSRQADRGGEVKNCRIYYTSVADYMTREEKLDYLVQNKSIASKSLEWKRLTPDEHGDWLNKRVGGVYDTYIRLGDKTDKSGENDKVFGDVYSRGLETARDSWCYGYSKSVLEHNMSQMTDYYNKQREDLHNGIINSPIMDSTKIKFCSNVLTDIEKNKIYVFNENRITESVYRPFVKSNLYYCSDWNHRTGQMPSIFPFSIMRQAGNNDNRNINRVICVENPGSRREFSCLMSDCLPDLHIMETTQCFPLYIYKTEDNSIKQKKQRTLFNGGEAAEHSADSSNRTSGITDWIFDYVNKKYNLVASSPSPFGRGGQGGEVTKEDIFYYVYGILHCPSYREKYQNDFKKALPRIPFVERYEDFAAFANAGRQLGDLHCNYESCPMNTTAKVYFDQVPLAFGEGDLGGEAYIIDKLRPVGKGNFTELKYNGHITIKNIPPEAHEYIVNGRSPLGWIIDQYQVSIDKDSGIKNDPNDWCREHGNPRYILELILRVIEVSARTMAIVKGLPKVEV